jgi:hypothetical protein
MKKVIDAILCRFPNGKETIDFDISIPKWKILKDVIIYDGKKYHRVTSKQLSHAVEYLKKNKVLIEVKSGKKCVLIYLNINEIEKARERMQSELDNFMKQHKSSALDPIRALGFEIE